MKFSSIKIPKIIALLPVAFLVGSCEANFKNVEEFGLKSALVREKSESMAKDIYQSCLRKAHYNTSELFPQSIGIENIAKDRQQKCAKNQQAAEVVNDANLVLISYMVALGKLASDDPVSFESNLANFQASFANLNTTLASVSPNRGIEEAEINAGFNIARFVFNQLITKFRRENLQEAILCTNEHIQEYIPGLNSIALDFYAQGILQSEGVTIDSYYRKYAPIPEEKTQLVALYTLEQDYFTAVNSLNEKKEAANAYTEILQATAKAHQELFDEFNQSDINAQKLEVVCQEYLAGDKDELSPQISSLSSQQLKKVNQIVMEYTDEIEPLVKKLDRAF